MTPIRAPDDDPHHRTTAGDPWMSPRSDSGINRTRRYPTPIAQAVPQPQQLVAEHRRIRWPAGRLFGHRLGHQPTHPLRNILGQRGRRLQQMGQGDRDGMLTGKGATTGQTLIGHHPKAYRSLAAVTGWPTACSGDR